MSNRTIHGDKATLNCPKVKQHRELTQELHKLYSDKNADYGDSFHKTFEEYGMTSVLIRLSDKLNRLKALQEKDAQVDESIRDTLMDLAGYCLLTILEIEEPSQEISDYQRIMSGWGGTKELEEAIAKSNLPSAAEVIWVKRKGDVEKFRQAMDEGDQTGVY